jgi:hypothetical protein
MSAFMTSERELCSALVRRVVEFQRNIKYEYSIDKFGEE